VHVNPKVKRDLAHLNSSSTHFRAEPCGGIGGGLVVSGEAKFAFGAVLAFFFLNICPVRTLPATNG